MEWKGFAVQELRLDYDLELLGMTVSQYDENVNFLFLPSHVSYDLGFL